MEMCFKDWQRKGEYSDHSASEIATGICPDFKTEQEPKRGMAG